MRKHVIIVFGNWTCSQMRKNFKPTPQVEFYLRTFAERRIKCFIVDEFRTSRVCNKCLHSAFDQETHKFGDYKVSDLIHPLK